jgi:hypothetical protein
VFSKLTCLSCSLLCCAGRPCPCSGGWAHALDLNAEVTVEAGDFKVLCALLFVHKSCAPVPDFKPFAEFRVIATWHGPPLVIPAARCTLNLLLRARAAQDEPQYLQLNSVSWLGLRSILHACYCD